MEVSFAFTTCGVLCLREPWRNSDQKSNDFTIKNPISYCVNDAHGVEIYGINDVTKTSPELIPGFFLFVIHLFKYYWIVPQFGHHWVWRWTLPAHRFRDSRIEDQNWLCVFRQQFGRFRECTYLRTLVCSPCGRRHCSIALFPRLVPGSSGSRGSIQTLAGVLDLGVSHQGAEVRTWTENKLFCQRVINGQLQTLGGSTSCGKASLLSFFLLFEAKDKIVKLCPCPPVVSSKNRSVWKNTPRIKS